MGNRSSTKQQQQEEETAGTMSSTNSSLNGEKNNNKKSEEDLRCTIPSAIAFIMLGAVWGSAFAFIRIGVDEETGFPPTTLVSFRLLVAGIGMIIMLSLAMIFSKSQRDAVLSHLKDHIFIKVIIMGIFNNLIPFVCVGIAEQTINSGVASILDASIPLFGIILAHFFLNNERMSFLKVIGLIIGFAGVVMVCLQKVNTGEEIYFDDFVGYFLVTVASASYAVASVFARKYLKDAPSLMMATGQICSAAILTQCLSFILDLGVDRKHYTFLLTANFWTWISVLYLAVLSTNVAYILYFYLIRTVGSTKQTMVGYLLPVFGVFEGALFLREWDGVQWWFIVSEILGAVMICGGIALVTIDFTSLINPIYKRITGKTFTPPKYSSTLDYGDDDDDDEANGEDSMANDLEAPFNKRTDTTQSTKYYTNEFPSDAVPAKPGYQSIE